MSNAGGSVELTHELDGSGHQLMTQLADHQRTLGPHDLELLQIDADILANQHSSFDPNGHPTGTHHEVEAHPGELAHPEDGLPIQLNDQDLQHRLQLDLLLHLDLGGHARQLRSSRGGGGDLLLDGDEAHLAALFADETPNPQYEQTLCKYILGQHQETACYGKPYRTREEAVDYVCANMTILENVEPSRVTFTVGPVTVLAPDWTAAMDHEVAKGTGYMEITVTIGSSSSAVSESMGSSRRKKTKFTHASPTSAESTNAVAGPSTYRFAPQAASAPELDLQLDPFQFDSTIPADPLLDSYSISSIDHISYPEGYVPHDLDPDSFFTQSQLPFFEPFSQPYDPPPSEDPGAADPLPPADVPMESGQYYTQPRPPIEDSQGLVDAPAEWNFPPNAFDGLLEAVKREAETVSIGVEAGAVGGKRVPNGVQISPPKFGRRAGGPFSVHPIGEQSSTAAKKRARSEEPEAQATAGQSTSTSPSSAKEKGTEKKKEKRKPSPYNLFYATTYAIVQADHPEMDNKACIREIARRWTTEPTNPNFNKVKRNASVSVDKKPTLYTEYYHIEYARLKAEDPSQSNEERNRVVANNWAVSPVNPKTRKRKRRAADATEDTSESYSPSGGATEALFLARRREHEAAGFARRLAALGEEEANNPRPHDYTEMGEEYPHSLEDDERHSAETYTDRSSSVDGQSSITSRAISNQRNAPHMDHLPFPPDPVPNRLRKRLPPRPAPPPALGDLPFATAKGDFHFELPSYLDQNIILGASLQQQLTGGTQQAAYAPQHQQLDGQGGTDQQQWSFGGPGEAAGDVEGMVYENEQVAAALLPFGGFEVGDQGMS